MTVKTRNQLKKEKCLYYCLGQISIVKHTIDYLFSLTNDESEKTFIAWLLIAPSIMQYIIDMEGYINYEAKQRMEEWFEFAYESYNKLIITWPLHSHIATNYFNVIRIMDKLIKM